MTTKFIELFAGIGGFRYGLENFDRTQDTRSQKDSQGTPAEGGRLVSEKGEGTSATHGWTSERTDSNPNSGAFTCVYSNEWDKYASQIYRRNYGYIHEADICTVGTDTIPDHDLLTGGFPCQAFSIAGLQGGFNDVRGTLFFEIARILRDKRPRHFILENVKNLLSHDKGKTFQTILKVLSDLGYRCEWQVLNSKYFGVPQNRERVYIIGHLRGECGCQVFPIAGEDRGVAEAIVSTAIDRNYWKGIDNHGQRTVIIHNKYGGFGETKLRVFENISPTIRTPKGGGHIPEVLIGSMIRKLTPVECCRLQAFPSWWTKLGIDIDGNEVVISNTQQYKAIGNAVTTTVISAIARAMIEAGCL